MPDGERGRLRLRQFTLLDSMVLIAATALCLVIPATIRRVIPASSYRTYDVRQYGLIVGAAWLLIIPWRWSP